jgi:small nuclear ribonucleoprotein G
MAPAQPELKKYIDKRLFVQLNGSRKVIGVLRGYDVGSAPFLSLLCMFD